MINELQLIKPLLRFDNYIRYKEYIDLQFVKDSSVELFYVYSVLMEMHDAYGKDLTLDDLTAYFSAKYPDAKTGTYEAIFAQLRESTLSEEIASDTISLLVKRKTLIKLSEAAFAASQGRKISDEDPLQMVVRLASELTGPAQASSDEQVFVSSDLEELLDATSRTNGLRWRLDCLNKGLGSLRKGDFGFIFARPETGKTTFLASECSNFLSQTDRPIVWFNNEEVGAKVMVRIYQAYFGVNLTTLMGNSAMYKRRFQEEVGNRMLMVDNPTTDRREVERILHKVQPALIIYDQIDKIKGFAADRDDLVYGAIYQWARELAKTYAPSMGVCQADGSAEGQKWLSMANVANAKTSKQAEADWILGLGKTNDQSTEGIRYLHLSKNKLPGDADSIAELRHGRFETLIRPDIARYQDIIRYD
jgi:hypothetical protein